MLSEANFGFSKGRALYTKPYFNIEAAEEKAVFGGAQNTEVVLGLILRYSLKLVNIVEYNPGAAERVTAYAAYLSSFDSNVRVALNLSDDQFKGFIDRVAVQETFLGALQVAQPIINRFGRYLDTSLNDFEAALAVLEAKIDRKIDLKHADLIRYQNTLVKEKYAVLAALEQVYLIAKGDKKAYARLLESKVITDKAILPKKSPDFSERQKILKHLAQRLDALHRIGEEIEPDWTIYRATHSELDALGKKTSQEVRQIRLMTLVWMRAHQKMAAGRTNPAEWFDINDAPGMLLKMGTKLIF
jgi:hypothetical protein